MSIKVSLLDRLYKDELDKDNDYVVIYDHSTSTVKRILTADFQSTNLPLNSTAGDFLVLGSKRLAISQANKLPETAANISSIQPIVVSAGNIVSMDLVSSGNALEIITDLYIPEIEYTRNHVVLSGVGGFSPAIDGIYVPSNDIVGFDPGMDYIFDIPLTTGTWDTNGTMSVINNYRVTTTTEHGYSIGDTIVIKNVSGFTQINGPQTVTDVISEYIFAIQPTFTTHPLPYVPDTGKTYILPTSSQLDLTFYIAHNLTTGQSIYIDSENPLEGFSQDLYGTFVADVLTDTTIRIPINFYLGETSYSGGAYAYLVSQLDYNFYYNEDKTVEAIFKNGRKKAFKTINGAINAASADGGSVLVHPKTVVYDERMILKSVNIMIEEGAIVTSSNIYGPIFTDEGIAVDCKILGNGIFKHTGNTDQHGFWLYNPNSNVHIECDRIETHGVAGGINNAVIQSNINNFSIKCNSILSERGGGIILDRESQNFNIQVGSIETGLVADTNTGSSALVTHGNGFIEVDSIVCNNLGHTLSHRKGECIAYIAKQKTVCNHPTYVTSTVAMIGYQTHSSAKLTLFFDEVLNLTGTRTGLPCFQIENGIVNLFGRKAYSSADHCVTYQFGSNTYDGMPSVSSGLINIKDIYSGNWTGLNIETTGIVTVDGCNVSANTTGGANWGVLKIGGSSIAVNSTAIIRNSVFTQLTSNAATHVVRVGMGTQNIVLSNNEFIATHSSSNSIYSTDDVEREVKVRLPNWQNRTEHSKIHYITNTGTLIQ